MHFFTRFRDALSRYHAGVHQLPPPVAGGDAALDAVQARLGCVLPTVFRDFLQQWNGALLFHEEVVIHGVAGTWPELDRLATGQLGLALGTWETSTLWLRPDDGQVLALDTATERIRRVGSSFDRWLDAVMARGALLYDPQGDLRENILDGVELKPRVLRKLAEAALRTDPEAPAWHEDLAQCLLDAGDHKRAHDALEKVVVRDERNGDAWFTLGRLREQAGQDEAAVQAFRAAAAAESTVEEAAFALAHAVRIARALGHTDEANAWSNDALTRCPQFVADQIAAIEHLLTERDVAAAQELFTLVHALAPDAPALHALGLRLRVGRSLPMV